MACTPEPKPSVRPSAMGPATMGQLSPNIERAFTGKYSMSAMLSGWRGGFGGGAAERARRGRGKIVAARYTKAAMSAVHLVCGPVGAGKTTFSRRLELERRAVRLS